MKTTLETCGLVFVAGSCLASVTLFDFETEKEKKSAPRITRADCTLCVTNVFASSRASSLYFRTAPWQKGMPEWPSFTLQTDVKDWSQYDRMVVDMVNTAEGGDSFNTYIAGPEGRIQNGLLASTMLPGFGYRQWVVPLKGWPGTANPKQIARVHFFSTRPMSMNLYLDRITLLKKGEKPAEPSAELFRQLVPFAQKEINACEADLAGLGVKTKPYCITPEMTKECEYQIQKVLKRLESVKTEITGGKPSLATMDAVEMEAGAIKGMEKRLTSFLKFWKECVQAKMPTDGMLVGKATTMEQVLPRDAEYDVKPAKSVSVRLARNEREGVQILVTPTQGGLKKVRVSVSDLKSAKGALFSYHTFKKENIACEVTGYVKTQKLPPYSIGYNEPTNEPPYWIKRAKKPFVGWWPNPILNFLDAVDVGEGDIQSFWLRFHCPADQKAGWYEGTIRVTAENARSVNVPLRLRVNDFSVGVASPLPLAITFRPEISDVPEEHEVLAAERGKPTFPCNAWEAHEMEWGNFLADYYITMDSLYHHTLPHYSVLNSLQAQGRLGVFNLGYWSFWDNSPDAEKKWREGTLPRLHAAYDAAEANGMAAKAYIYGCDEVPTNYFKNVQAALATLKKEFPGVPIMTTAYDQSYGQDSGLSLMDAFCPLTPKFDPAQAEKVRKAGRQVWWYICCGPHTPYANMFIECPAIEGRLLMGPMTTRMRPDGFLYYQITIWDSVKPITSGPFTDWNPRSWTFYHGDGAWTCAGPDGKPLPTQRLENFRDGLEDFAYAKLLEEKLGARAKKDKDAWADAARAALAVPQELMRDMSNFSYDPGVLYAWRDSMADLIESADKR